MAQTVEPSVPAWETKTKQRITEALPNIKKHARTLRASSANEATTRSVVSEMLSYALGYDTAEDIDQESEIREGRADYGLRAKGEMIALVEVKRIGTTLSTRHLNQLETYALHRGVRWAILTNGQMWQLHHIDGGTPTTTTLVTEVDLLDGSWVSTHLRGLFAMSKEALQRNFPINQWRENHAKSPAVLQRALLSDQVIRVLSSAVYKEAQYRLTPADLRTALSESVIRANLG
jgi:predicted type IV restriction endonuclease